MIKTIEIQVGEELALVVTTDGCTNAALWTHDIAAGQSYGQERYYYIRNAQRNYATNCQQSQAVYPQQVETTGWQDHDSQLFSYALTTVYITPPSGRYDIQVSQVLPGATQMPYQLTGTASLMVAQRFAMVFIFAAAVVILLAQWKMAIGFDAFDVRWWRWLLDTIIATGGLPNNILYPLWWTGAGALIAMAASSLIFNRPGSRTLHGGIKARYTHGSARWATRSEVRKSGLLARKGVVVGGIKGFWGTRPLRHDGPEHVMCFAPTRSGKGVALVLPTLLSWKESVLVLDIKGENYALTAGWRAKIGQRVLRFDPAALSGSVRYNPLAEVRLETDYEIADCQNIASMIIDPDGKGLKDFWMQSGFDWLSAAILHVLYRISKVEKRTATLADVHAFMSVGDDDIVFSDKEEPDNPDESFNKILEDMAMFDHGSESVNAKIRHGAGRMFKRAAGERSGVHSSAMAQLALYSDPIVAANTSACDFRISNLMNGDQPTSLYIVIPPSDIQRLRPLVRILMNQFLNRLMTKMEFEKGEARRHYRYRLLLMLDEFTSIGKLEIFEKALAFMAGYGLKAFIIVQDPILLRGVYGREEAITSNCHIKIATAPNNIETAKLLSEMVGKTTVTTLPRSSTGPKGRRPRGLEHRR